MTDPSKEIILVTCKMWPDLSKGDALLADQLTARGHNVRHLPWNDAPITEFTSADLVVLRSNWDFHHDLAAFSTWLNIIEQSDIELHNPIGLVRPFLDKSYLKELATAGFRTPKTMITTDFDAEIIRDWPTRFSSNGRWVRRRPETEPRDMIGT